MSEKKTRVNSVEQVSDNAVEKKLREVNEDLQANEGNEKRKEKRKVSDSQTPEKVRKVKKKKKKKAPDSKENSNGSELSDAVRNRSESGDSVTGEDDFQRGLKELTDALEALEIEPVNDSQNESELDEIPDFEENIEEALENVIEDSEDDFADEDDFSDLRESEDEFEEEIDGEIGEEINEEIDDDRMNAMEELDENPDLKKHRRRKKVRKGLLIFAGLFILVYAGVAVYFMSHFLPFTTINGNDFSGKNESQVQRFMQDQVDNYTLTLKESDGGTEVIDGTDISLEYVKDDSVEKLLKSQNAFFWIQSLWEHPEITASVGVKYDKDKLDKVIENLVCMKPEEQVESVAAHPEFQNTEFVIVEEVVGTQIDTEKFHTEVHNAIEGFLPELDLKEAGCYILPKYVKDSPEVAAARDAMNQYLRANITYDFNPFTEVVDASVISQWVTVDAEMNVTFNQDSVRGYIAALAEKYDTYGKPRSFVTGYGNTVEVTGGNFGWRIDQEAEYAALTANIQNGETVTREANYANRGLSHDVNDFGNTYVEVDLTNQHMFFFQNGQCILQSDIVTGNPNEGNATPQGTYTLAYKQKDTVLRGPKQPDGSYKWESPVSYWMPFNGGIGLHDAPWRSSFGGSIYVGGGSHGCVNLPPDVAAQLYGYVDAGTPVICHY